MNKAQPRKNTPFPRKPDGLRDAWCGELGRFTPTYEARAETLWQAVEQLGLIPELAWAGSEDGEALIVTEQPDGDLVWLAHLEDPNEQAEIDSHIADGDLGGWIRAQIQSGSAGE